MATIMNVENQYDRAEEVKRFDESKMGVKGLVDSGLTAIPRFFIHPPETRADLKSKSKTKPESVSIPTIDLSGPRATVVGQVASAARTFGFFQIVNHGIPLQVLDRTIAAIRAFHEQPTDVKARFYRREASTGVSYISNFDLFQSKAADWRDTIQIKLGPKMAELNEIPEVCRKAVVQWNTETKTLGDRLMGMLSEGLGLDSDRIKNTTCSESRTMVCHYYPRCPQPDLTMGVVSQTDPGALAVLLQDHIGGLQIKHGGEWVDVNPVPGALVINIADVLQIMSNDEYKSVDHRVLANASHEARVSVIVYFNASAREDLYGPFPELTSPEKPALYQRFTYNDYLTRFFSKGLDENCLRNYYKL